MIYAFFIRTYRIFYIRIKKLLVVVGRKIDVCGVILWPFFNFYGISLFYQNAAFICIESRKVRFEWEDKNVRADEKIFHFEGNV